GPLPGGTPCVRLPCARCVCHPGIRRRSTFSRRAPMELTALRSPARPCVVRRGAAAAAALVLALGAAACTGDEEQPAPAPSSETAPTAGGPAAGPSDGGGQEVTEADLDTATDRFLGFLRTIDDQDWDAACGLVLDP